MVKIANTGSWLLGLLAIAGRRGTLVGASNNIVEGAFIVEYEDGFVSKTYQKAEQHRIQALAWPPNCLHFRRSALVYSVPTRRSVRSPMSAGALKVWREMLQNS